MERKLLAHKRKTLNPKELFCFCCSYSFLLGVAASFKAFCIDCVWRRAVYSNSVYKLNRAALILSVGEDLNQWGGVHFDDFGHPRFEANVPIMADGKGKISYNPSKINGEKNLDGIGDIGRANSWALKNLKPNYRNIGTSKNRFEIKDDQEKWIECVWHHHEDGKNLIPVPKTLHDKALSTGVAHTGGASILNAQNGLRDLIGFFPELKF